MQSRLTLDIVRTLDDDRDLALRQARALDQNRAYRALDLDRAGVQASDLDLARALAR